MKKVNLHQDRRASSRFALTSYPGSIERKLEGNSREPESGQGDLRCVACGSYNDLKGHVDYPNSSRIFFLCARCCEKIHG